MGSYDWSFRDLSSYCVELLEKLQIIIWTYYFRRVENIVIHILSIYRNLNSNPPEKKTQLQNDQQFRNLWIELRSKANSNRTDHRFASREGQKKKLEILKMTSRVALAFKSCFPNDVRASNAKDEEKVHNHKGSDDDCQCPRF